MDLSRRQLFIGWLAAPLTLQHFEWGGARRRVFYLNSYHEGYGSSDDGMRGISNVLRVADVELKIFLLDSKRRAQRWQFWPASVRHKFPSPETNKPKRGSIERWPHGLTSGLTRKCSGGAKRLIE